MVTFFASCAGNVVLYPAGDRTALRDPRRAAGWFTANATPLIIEDIFPQVYTCAGLGYLLSNGLGGVLGGGLQSSDQGSGVALKM